MSERPGVDDRTGAGAGSAAASPLDAHVPQSARVYDYLLGGKDNYAADRVVGAALMQQVPTLPTMVRAQRRFLARAVRFLVRDVGIRQFLDVGTGLPSADNVHEVAQAVDPTSRIVYVDNDPLVLAHARALRSGEAAGATAFLGADLRDPESILGSPLLAATLDRDEPIALFLIGVLHHLRDGDRPYDAVARLVDWLPAASHVVIAGPGSDFDPAAMAMVAGAAEQSGIPYVPRARQEWARFLDGLTIIEPGVVPIPDWKPDPEATEPIVDVYGWAGAGRKD